VSRDLKKPNILHVRFGTRAGALGGGGTRLIEVSKRWQGDCSLYVITHKATFLWHRQLGLKASPYYLIDYKWAWRQNFPSIIFCIINALLFSPKKPMDIVYSRSHYLFDLVPSIWMKIWTKAALVVYIGSHVIPPSRGRSRLVRTLVYLDHILSVLLMKAFAKVIFVFNAYDRETLCRLGIDTNKVYVLNYGIDLEKINDVLVSSAKEYEGLYFGRICKAKGSHELIAAWREVVKRIPDAELLMFGPIDHYFKKELINMIDILGIKKNVIIREPIYEDEEKYKLIKKSKLFVLPSYVDTWCIALAEALACQTPAVVYELPTLKTVYGDAVITCRKGNIKDLAEKTLQILDDEDLRETKAKEGYERVKKYTWERSSKRELQIIKNMFARAKCDRRHVCT